MGRRSESAGRAGEQIAEMQLRMLGVEMVENIPTPIALAGSRKIGHSTFYNVIYKQKATGDIAGIMGDGSGRRVLVEVKSRNDDRLQWSALRDHQIERLDENHRLNGVSLVVFIDGSGNVFVLRWPIEGFGPRKSITSEQAASLIWDGK